MSPTAKLKIDLLGLGHQSRTHRATRSERLPVARTTGTVRQLEEVGDLRQTPVAPSSTSGIGHPPELKEPSLLRMSCRLARHESLARRPDESPCIEVMLNSVGASRG